MSESSGVSTAPCLTLLRVGFAEPGWSPNLLVSSYLTVSPLPRGLKPARRSTFCCTFPGLAAGGRYPSPCPAQPGLSSRRSPSRADMAALTGSRPAAIRSTPHSRSRILPRSGKGKPAGQPAANPRSFTRPGSSRLRGATAVSAVLQVSFPHSTTVTRPTRPWHPYE